MENQENVAGADVATESTVAAAIKANFDNKVDVKDVKFHFKKVTDDAGNESKRPTVELQLPVPSVEGIVDILTKGGKGLELLLEAVADKVMERARDIVNEKEDISQENFPMLQLSWEEIANMPKAERRGGGIPKEQWEEFAKDYEAVMPAATGKAVDKIKMAIKVFMQKFSAVKTDKKVLALLKQQLAIYATTSPNAEQFTDCIEFLDKKAQTLIEAESSNILDAL